MGFILLPLLSKLCVDGVREERFRFLCLAGLLSLALKLSESVRQMSACTYCTTAMLYPLPPNKKTKTMILFQSARLQTEAQSRCILTLDFQSANLQIHQPCLIATQGCALANRLEPQKRSRTMSTCPYRPVSSGGDLFTCARYSSQKSATVSLFRHIFETAHKDRQTPRWPDLDGSILRPALAAEVPGYLTHTCCTPVGCGTVRGGGELFTLFCQEMGTVSLFPRLFHDTVTSRRWTDRSAAH